MHQEFACTDRRHKPQWRVLQRHYNRSAFNGYRVTPSAYSLVQCLKCDRIWRTRAAYVADLEDE
jgi:hypothetical protein